MYNKDNTKEADEILMRISSEMERQKRRQAELIRYLDLPAGTYTNWKLRKSRNFCEHLQAIALFLKVDPGWLLTGKTLQGATRDEGERELLEEFRKLDAEKQQSVVQNIRWLVK